MVAAGPLSRNERLATLVPPHELRQHLVLIPNRSIAPCRICANRSLLATRAHAVRDELRQRGEAGEVRIALPLPLYGRDGNVAVVVARIQARRGIELRDLLQALVHLLRVASAQIASPAGIHEHRVAREDGGVRAFDLPAGGSRSMTRRVQRADAQRSHLDHIASGQELQIAAQLRIELPRVRRVDVDGNPLRFEQRRKSVHVIEVVMADERVGHSASVLLCGAQSGIDVPGGVDDGGLGRPFRAHEIDEVLHRPELELAYVESHPGSPNTPAASRQGAVAATPAAEAVRRGSLPGPAPCGACAWWTTCAGRGARSSGAARWI